MPLPLCPIRARRSQSWEATMNQGPRLLKMKKGKTVLQEVTGRPPLSVRDQTPGLSVALSPLPPQGRGRTYWWMKEMGQYVPLLSGACLPTETVPFSWDTVYVFIQRLRPCRKSCIPSTDCKPVNLNAQEQSKEVHLSLTLSLVLPRFY